MFRYAFLALLLAVPLRADGPADNLPDKVRRVPPPGIKFSEADRIDLKSSLDLLLSSIERLGEELSSKPALLELLPDVQVFYKVVHDAVTYDEIYDTREIGFARKQLQLGMERAQQLREGKAPWLSATGLVVRGYKSKIDDSIQPYGLVVPASYQSKTAHKFRLDFWCHGRGEKLTELSFVQQRLTNPGEFTPPNAFVLHLYGRYCNANKFAGEVDLFEAYDSVKKHYPIDENRLVIRGFSMGGAACWQFAVHYPSFFCAAAPGAGFSETPEFLKVFQKEDVKPTAYERQLWRLHDCPGYCVNLFGLPTVAYSGEVDAQKQAADVMEKALKNEGMVLTHIIGPKTGHSYHPQAKAEINQRIDAIAARGRNPVPGHVKFGTYTLRYNRAFWVSIDGLDQHWEQGAIDARIVGDNAIRISTRNISAFTLNFGPGQCPLDATRRPQVLFGGQRMEVGGIQTDRSWVVHFRKNFAGSWEVVGSLDDDTLRKRPGLQGPIDDAFLDRFIMVAPTGKPINERLGQWADAEMKHAIEHWRRQFRGAAIVRKDIDVTDAEIATSNLVLWGDPASNKVLAKIADKLPIAWSVQSVRVGDKEYDPISHVPVLIYPNPLNPKKYVVLNSGFTFREYDYLNNARQVPKLPDWAVIDVSKPATSRAPGGIVAAGFFDEEWKLKKN